MKIYPILVILLPFLVQFGVGNKTGKPGNNNVSQSPDSNNDSFDLVEDDTVLPNGMDAPRAAVAAAATGNFLDIRPCGRCGGRTIMVLVAESGRELVYVVDGVEYRFDPNRYDFRMGNDHEHRFALSIAMRAYAERYYEWLGNEAPADYVAAQMENGVVEWYNNIMNADLVNPENLGVDFWADDRILIGAGLHHDVNVDIFNGINGNVNQLFRHVRPSPDGRERDTITLGFNGVHFDLRNQAEHWNNRGDELDKRLWPESTNPFHSLYQDMPLQRVQRIVNFVRDMIEDFQAMEHVDADMEHLAGAIPSLLPPDLVLRDEAILRLIGRLPPSFFEMIMANGFRGDRMTLEALDAIRRQAEQCGLNPDIKGGEYIRCYVGQYEDIRQKMEQFLESPRDGFVHMPGFFRSWLDRNDGLDPDTVCSIPYFGEVSSGTVTARHDAEDNPNKKDGAEAQWEFFQIFPTPHRGEGATNSTGFIFGHVEPGNKEEAWILEALIAGLIQMATIRTLASLASVGAVAYIAMRACDGSALNNVNCGRPWFNDHKWWCGQSSGMAPE